METNKKIQNVVSFSGVVVSMYETQACHVMTLAITTPVRKRDGSFSTVTNYPRIYFFKNDKCGAENIKVGMCVNILGHVAAPRKTRPDGTVYYSQSFIGEKIEEVKTAMADAGIETASRANVNENLIYLEGVVQRVERVAENVAIFTLAAYNKRFYNRVTAVTFDSRNVIIAPGNTVRITGSASTSTRERKNGEKQRYESIVIRKIEDLGKLPEDHIKRDYKAEKQAAIEESYNTQPLD